MKFTVEIENVDELSEFLRFIRVSNANKEKEKLRNELSDKFCQPDIRGLGWPVRIETLLSKMGVHTLAHAATLSDIDCLKTPNFGRNTLTEFRRLLEEQTNVGIEPPRSGRLE